MNPPAASGMRLRPGSLSGFLSEKIRQAHEKREAEAEAF
jgi:hypothetical protein